MGKYTEKNAAKETNSSVRDVKKAWHSAKDDAAASGHLEERNINKVSDSKNGPILYKIFKKLSK